MAYLISDKEISTDIFKKVVEWKEAYDKACALGRELDEYFDDKLDVCVFENSYEVLTEKPEEASQNYARVKFNGACVSPVAFKVENTDKWVSMETFF